MMKKYMVLVSIILAVAVVASACAATDKGKAVMDGPSVTKTPAPTENPAASEDPDNPTPGAASVKTRSPEEIFRFVTTALPGEGGEVINPTGMLLNIGCEDCQDIFYASRSLTVLQVIEKIKADFGVEEMLADENFVRFNLHIDEVRRLEIELDLIAAKQLTVGDEILDIRVISIAPEASE